MKIRKVEVTQDEFFEELTQIISIDERIPHVRYMGSNLNNICKSLGIKSLDFWKLKFENENKFNEKFVIKRIGPNDGVFSIWRKERYEKDFKK